MKLQIKYIVSRRCIIRVQEVIESVGLHVVAIDLYNVEIEEQLTAEQKSQIARSLLESGLQLREDKEYALFEKARKWIVDTIESCEEDDDKHLIAQLCVVLDCTQRHIANVFTRYLNISLLQYIIAQRIERVKHLLQVEQMSLTNIAYKLNYSSVAHLSYQFKNVTGMTPTDFKQQGLLLQRSAMAA